MGLANGFATESRRRGDEKNLSRKSTGTMCVSASYHPRMGPRQHVLEAHGSSYFPVANVTTPVGGMI